MAILNTNVKNANIKFLNGLQSDLNTLITNGGAIKGAFYLTSDTHRLYIGQEDNNRTDLTAGAARVVPVPVNEGVTTVANINALPSVANNDKAGVAGSFYYAAAENILCVYNGDTWVQINPDTNTTIDYFYHDIVTANGKTTLSSKLKDNNGVDTIANLEFVGANGVTISSVSEESFPSGVYTSTAAKRITITGDNYNLSNSITSTANKATITLASSDTNKQTSSINIIGKDNIIFGTEGGDITIEGVNTYLSSLTIAAAPDNGNGFRITGTDNNGNTIGNTVDPIIHFDVDGGADYHFVNGVANLPLYTKNEIDLVLRQLNSMTYKGVVGYGQILTSVPNGNSTTDTSGNVRLISVGDTYKIGASDQAGNDSGFTIPTGTNSTVTVHKGDLIIAQGTEYTNANYPSGHPELIGTINPSTLYWGYVPAGDDTIVETTYTGVAIQHGIKISDSGGVDVARFKVHGDGTYISITDSADLSGNAIPIEQTVTVNHALVDTTTYQDSTVQQTVSQNTNNKLTIPVITQIQRDAAGHVLKTITTNYEVTDTVSEVDTFNTTTSTDSNNSYAKIDTQIITTTENDTNISNKTASFVIESSTLKVDAATKTVGTSTLNSVKMELVWGSF